MTDRVERLTNLLALLLETREPLTFQEVLGQLVGQYPESEQARRGAFERDKATLREIGVPIEQEMGIGGQAGQTRYWIDRDRYELADLELDDDERRALQVAMAAIRPGSAAAQDALWKVGAGTATPTNAIRAVLPDDANLPVVRDAITQCHQVGFHYRGVERQVDPWGLLLRDGFWYLVGYDHTRGDRRTYRLDRVDGAITADSDTSFDRPDGFRAGDAFPTDPKMIGVDDEPVVARVRISGARAALVAAEVGAERIVGRDTASLEGSVEVEVPASNEAAFRAWLFDFGAAAEVLAPPEVRTRIIDWLQEVAS